MEECLTNSSISPSPDGTSSSTESIASNLTNSSPMKLTTLEISNSTIQLNPRGGGGAKMQISQVINRLKASKSLKKKRK